MVSVKNEQEVTSQVAITPFAGFNYVAEDPTYTFKFCGVVTEWTVLAGNEGTLQLQVWRRLSNTDYQMIGENYCIITSKYWRKLLYNYK